MFYVNYHQLFSLGEFEGGVCGRERERRASGSVPFSSQQKELVKHGHADRYQTQTRTHSLGLLPANLMKCYYLRDMMLQTPEGRAVL